MKRLLVIGLILINSTSTLSQLNSDGTLNIDALFAKAKQIEIDAPKQKERLNRLHDSLEYMIKYRDSINKIPYDTLSNRFVRLLNQYRKSKGLCSLLIDMDYVQASKWMTRYMDSTNILKHNINVADMESPLDRLNYFSGSYSYKHSWDGEVLCYVSNIYISSYINKKTIEQIYLDIWLNSPGHKKIILKPDVKVIGAFISLKHASALVGAR